MKLWLIDVDPESAGVMKKLGEGLDIVVGSGEGFHCGFAGGDNDGLRWLIFFLITITSTVW